MGSLVYCKGNHIILRGAWVGSKGFTGRQRTSDGGNGNHSVSLPIILIKILIDQMLPSSYIS